MTMNLNPDLYPPGDSQNGAPVLRNDQGSLSTNRLYPVGSPEWWLERLIKRLKDRAAYCRDHWSYYEGNQPLAFASEKFVATYGHRYRSLPANFMPLVVDAEKERLIVQGFRFGKSVKADDAVWRMWQTNNLDSESQIAHEMVLAKGAAYTLVTPQPGEQPLITIEDPEQVVLETLPGNRRKRLAALKVWRGDDGYARAYLYLPDWVYKWRSIRANQSWSTSLGTALGSDGAEAGATLDRATSWQPELPIVDGGPEDFPIKNPLGVVPVVPLLNRPKLDGSGRSELGPVIGNQSAINFLRFSALIGSDHAALPQRWARNLDLEVDEDTGSVIVPFKVGIQHLWTTQRPSADEAAAYGDKYPETEFGQFPAADLSPFVSLINMEVAQLAANSRTPYHYLLGDPRSVPPTGESIKSSEAPLVKKTVAESIHLGEGWEETIRVGLVAMGQSSKARTDAETLWADPETRNEWAHSQAVLEQYKQGLLPSQFALEELGYTASQIARIEELRAAEPAPPPAAGSNATPTQNPPAPPPEPSIG